MYKLVCHFNKPIVFNCSSHHSVSVGATRVIEKSVLVDNLIAKISKSADSLSDNKDFKDTMFTRIPSE